MYKISLSIFRRPSTVTLIALSFILEVHLFEPVSFAYADDPLQLLAACRNATPKNRHTVRVKFQRRDGDWRLVDINAYNRVEFDLDPLKNVTSIEAIANLNSVRSSRVLTQMPRLKTLSANARVLLDAVHLDGKLDSLESLTLDGEAENVSSVLSRPAAFPSLRTLEVNAHISDDDLNKIAAFGSVEGITITSKAITGAGMGRLAGMSKLKRIALYQTNYVTASDLKAFCDLSNLTDLTLFPGVSVDAVSMLSAIPRLENLTCYFEGAQVVDLRDLRTLRSYAEPNKVNVSGNWPTKLLPPISMQELKISGRCIPEFADNLKGVQSTVPQIESVSIVGVEDSDVVVHSIDLSWMRTLPRLKRLVLEDAAIGEYAQIAGLKNLQSVAIESLCPMMFNEVLVPSGDLSWLREFTKLERFKCNSRFYDVSEEGIAILSHLPKLEYLSLTSSVWPQSIETILKMPELRSLHLHDKTGRTSDLDKFFVKLAALKNLEEIEIQGNVTDEGLSHLALLPKLRILDLRHTNGFTDSGLAHVMNMSLSLNEVIK